MTRQQAIPCLLQGRNVIACAPTGSGKTAAFVLPMLALLQESKSSGFRALIVTPTRELAKQIHTEILLLGGQRRFKTMLLTKANFATLSHETERNDALRHDILITTPQAIFLSFSFSHVLSPFSALRDGCCWAMWRSQFAAETCRFDRKGRC